MIGNQETRLRGVLTPKKQGIARTEIMISTATL
jgi:hypothetical protein